MTAYKPKSILVATDMSHRSDRAMQRAFHLARELKAHLTVFSAFDDAMPAELVDALHERAGKMLKRHAKSLGEGVSYDVQTKVGDPTLEILQAVTNTGADLLIMGTHRPRPFLDGLRDTTMQRIVRRTDCAVLLVRDPVDHDYKSILSATDFSPAATSAIQMSNALAPKAQIIPVHALHVPYRGMLGTTVSDKSILEQSFRLEVEPQAKAWVENNDLPTSAMEDVQITAGSPYTLLRGLVEKKEFDLICVGAHGRVGAAPSILGSLSTDLMRDPPCDVLITRPHLG